MSRKLINLRAVSSFRNGIQDVEARGLSQIHEFVRLGRRDSGAAIAAFHYQGTVPVLIAKAERKTGGSVESHARTGERA